mmetsp:Transcript_37279/g.117298  ORF Transcript_37279/g.117298 Transcript_37279/m.117298 type:complete len:335 (-) Transcript_37279:1134-2138(-)
MEAVSGGAAVASGAGQTGQACGAGGAPPGCNSSTDQSKHACHASAAAARAVGPGRRAACLTRAAARVRHSSPPSWQLRACAESDDCTSRRVMGCSSTMPSNRRKPTDVTVNAPADSFAWITLCFPSGPREPRARQCKMSAQAAVEAAVESRPRTSDWIMGRRPFMPAPTVRTRTQGQPAPAARLSPPSRAHKPKPIWRAVQAISAPNTRLRVLQVSEATGTSVVHLSHPCRLLWRTQGVTSPNCGHKLPDGLPPHPGVPRGGAPRGGRPPLTVVRAPLRGDREEFPQCPPVPAIIIPPRRSDPFQVPPQELLSPPPLAPAAGWGGAGTGLWRAP